MKIQIGKKEKTVILIALLSFVFAIFISTWVVVTLFVFYVLIVFFLYLNWLLKKTNWWKNQFVFTHQFISNQGYRKNSTRNIEIVNVGSNPARFAFDYDKLILGANWSTGNQGLDMDYQLLRFYHSFMKEGATVLIPIVPFSSVSAYLIPSIYKDKSYMVKFYSVLDYLQAKYLPQFKHVRYWYKYPLLFNWLAVRFLLRDVKPDKRILYDSDLTNRVDAITAELWMDNWKSEFNIKDLEAPLSLELQKARRQSVQLMKMILDYITERGYKPVFIMPPVSKKLSTYFTERFREIYIDSFIREFSEYNVPYFDYTKVLEFQTDDLFFNDLFMNVKGRTTFTKRVLIDLKMI